jgi:hypothetical protein
MSSIKTLMDELNARDFRVFPQKENPGKFTMSIKDGEERFFLTRTTSGELNEDGTANYKWSRGAQMRPQGEQA